MKLKGRFLSFLIFLIMVALNFSVTESAQATEQIQSYFDSNLYETEFNDSYEAANYITGNTVYTGNLSTERDFDYYKFTLDTPGSVLIEFSNIPDLGYNCWRVRLYQEDVNGNKEVLDSIDTGRSAYTTMDKKRLAAGTYYVVVDKGYNSYSNTDYILKTYYTAESAESFEQEFNDSYSQANKIKPGNAYTGNLSSDKDYDYFKITLDTPGSILIEVSNNPDLQHECWRVRLYKEDVNGNKEILDSIDTGRSAYNAMDKKRLAAGTYFVVIDRGYNSYSNTDYILKTKYTAETVDDFEQEFNDSYSQANKIKLGNTYTGNLSSDKDYDYFKFTLDTPGSILIEVSNSPDLQYDCWTVILYQEDVNGNKYKLDSMDVGRSAYEAMDKKRLPAGTYYVVIDRGYNSYSNLSYKLKLNYKAEKADSFEQEFNDSYSQANKIKIGSTHTGNLSSNNDNDYYKFTFTKDMNLLIKFKNTGVTGYNLWTIKIYKENKHGDKTKLDEYSLGRSSTENIKYYNLSAGTYYVVVNAYSYSNSDYQLTVKENKPGKIGNFKVTKVTSNSSTLAWKKATDARGYYIFRSTKKSGGYKLVARVNETKYTAKKLASGKTYYYKICAVNVDGYLGAYSKVLSAKTK